MGSKLLWTRVWQILKALDTLHAPAAPFQPRETELCFHSVRELAGAHPMGHAQHCKEGANSSAEGRARHEGRGGEESSCRARPGKVRL